MLRDPRSLAMALAIPLLLLLLFGYALTLDVDNVPLAVWDQDRTPSSRELVSRFAGSRYFTLRYYHENYSQIEADLAGGQALAALVVPAGFAGDLEAGRAVAVQLLLDGSDANTATLAQGYATAVVQPYSQQVQLQALRRQGLPAPPGPVELRPRIWYNPDMESRYYLIPGLIAVIMMVIAAMLTSLTVAREWERGTMEQLLSTPVRRHEFIAGKWLPYFVIGMVDVLLAVLAGEFIFDVPLRGSVLLLFGAAAIFLAGVLALGLLVSVVARNQLLANELAMVLTFLPSFLLSGFMFSISNMPTPLQVLSYIVPARYFVAILKGIYMKGAGLALLAGEGLLLVLFSLAMIALATARFRRSLE